MAALPENVDFVIAAEPTPTKMAPPPLNEDPEAARVLPEPPMPSWMDMLFMNVEFTIWGINNCEHV